MPAKYHAVPVWGREDRRLSQDAKVLRNYVLRAPTRTSEGLFVLPLQYAIADTGLGEDKILDAFGELSRAGLFEYDAENEVALDRISLKVNPLKNPRSKDGDPVVNEKTGEPKIDKRIPHAVRLFGQIPDSSLKVEFIVLADRFSPDLAEAIRSDSVYNFPSTEAPSKDHASPFQGPSKARVETSSSREGESKSSDVSSKSTKEESSACEECHFEDAVFETSDGVKVCASCIALKRVATTLNGEVVPEEQPVS